MQQQGESTSLTTGETQVTMYLTKEVHGTYIIKQKQYQGVIVIFSEQKGPSERKPDSGRSRHAEELKENEKKNKKAEMQRQNDNFRKVWTHDLRLAEKGWGNLGRKRSGLCMCMCMCMCMCV